MRTLSELVAAGYLVEMSFDGEAARREAFRVQVVKDESAENFYGATLAAAVRAAGLGFLRKE